MNEFAQNLKRIRIEKNYTQEDLAEALFVTRQTVSGWETGRTEPDIESFMAISEFLQVDMTSLVQGTRKESYRTMQKKYIVWSVILGLIVLGGIAAHLWLRPWIIDYSNRTYDQIPYYLYLTGVIPLWFASLGAFIPCILSLWLDLRIRKYWNIIPLILGITALIPAFTTALQFALWNPSKSGTTVLNLWFPFVLMPQPHRPLWTVILPFLGGAGLFLGINSFKAKPE